MTLYLIRHGEAKSKEEDPGRGLTDVGAANAQRAGNFLKKVLLQNKHASIWHSGKKRAEQTARIVAETLKHDIPVETRKGLAPNDDISIIKKEIETVRQDALVIIGHLPYLSRLASALLTGDQEREIIHFRNVCIVCLAAEGEGEFRSWALQWMVVPNIINN
jgi:phosphohistidine phosphatase